MIDELRSGDCQTWIRIREGSSVLFLNNADLDELFIEVAQTKGIEFDTTVGHLN